MHLEYRPVILEGIGGCSKTAVARWPSFSAQACAPGCAESPGAAVRAMLLLAAIQLQHHREEVNHSVEHGRVRGRRERGVNQSNPGEGAWQLRFHTAIQWAKPACARAVDVADNCTGGAVILQGGLPAEQRVDPESRLIHRTWIPAFAGMTVGASGLFASLTLRAALRAFKAQALISGLRWNDGDCLFRAALENNCNEVVP